MRRDDSDRPPSNLQASDDLFGGSARQGVSGGRDDPEDAVELWARRFGRGLAVLASIALIAWALATYGVPGGQ